MNKVIQNYGNQQADTPVKGYIFFMITIKFLCMTVLNIFLFKIKVGRPVYLSREVACGTAGSTPPRSRGGEARSAGGRDTRASHQEPPILYKIAGALINKVTN